MNQDTDCVYDRLGDNIKTIKQPSVCIHTLLLSTKQIKDRHSRIVMCKDINQSHSAPPIVPLQVLLLTL